MVFFQLDVLILEALGMHFKFESGCSLCFVLLCHCVGFHSCLMEEDPTQFVAGVLASLSYNALRIFATKHSMRGNFIAFNFGSSYYFLFFLFFSFFFLRQGLTLALNFQ